MPSIPVGTAPVPVVGDNAARQAFSVRNASTAGQVIYIDNVKPDGLTTGNAAHPLSVGESLNFILMFDGPDIRQPWSAIASAGAATLYYKEYNERQGV
jgi:hypothetical protein